MTRAISLFLFAVFLSVLCRPEATTAFVVTQSRHTTKKPKSATTTKLTSLPTRGQLANDETNRPPKRSPRREYTQNTAENPSEYLHQNRMSPKPNSQRDMLEMHKKLNQRLVAAQSADHVFRALQEVSGALTKTAGGGVLSTINFATAIHRLARHSLQPNARAPILADPRLALLLSGFAEALASGEVQFTTRELSNTAWALAKIRLIPPASAMPISMSVIAGENSATLRQQAKQIRLAVVQASKAQVPGQPISPVWIPLLSKLAGVLMDEFRLLIAETNKFQQQELSNFLWASATAERSDPAVFGKVIAKLLTPSSKSNADIRNDRSSPQSWSNLLWASAKAKVHEGHQDMIAFVADLTKDEDYVAEFKPQEYSNALWGIATLLSSVDGDIPPATAEAALSVFRSFVPHIISNIEGFKTQELSNVVWSFATVGFGLIASPESSTNNYLVLPSNDSQLDRQLMESAVETIVNGSHSKIRLFRSQELNNICWSFARLGARNFLGKNEASRASFDAVLSDIGAQLCHPKRRVTSQDLSMTIWGLATMEFFDDQLYRSMVSRFTSEMAQVCKPQEISTTCWALATAGIDVGMEKVAFEATFLSPAERPVPNDPVTRFCGIAAKELIRRPGDFKTQECKDILWSFSKLEIRFPELFRRIAEHLVGNENSHEARGLSEFSCQALANLAWAYARQAQLSELFTERHGATHPTGRLGVKTVGYADIGEALLHKLFREIAETDLHIHNNLSKLTTQDIANTAWAFNLLGLCHDELFANCWIQAQQRIERYLGGERNPMTYFKGQEVSNLLSALATSNADIHGSLDSIGAYLPRISQDSEAKLSIRSISAAFKRHEIANIAFACYVIGDLPPKLMKFLYFGLLGDQTNIKELSDTYQDGGLQSQAITILLYTQAALDLSATSHGLSLPPSFPEGWQQASTSSKGSDAPPIFELQLSTSKIQRDVSSAFKSIGFEHVEEHVITMEDLAQKYGINMAPLPNEVLSIDIANLEERIAIEVDGPSHFVTIIDTEGESNGFVAMNKGKVEYKFDWNGDRQRINGPTAMKQRLLTSLGWKVIHLPFWDWYVLENEQAKEDYCKNLLANLGGS